MIAVDPLYVLLLIELACILSGVIVFLVRKSAKFRTLYQDTLKEVMDAKQAEEDLERQLREAKKRTAAPAATAPQSAPAGTASADNGADLEALREHLKSVEEELQEKTKKMEQLQAKFADLEKEYMVLYQQQQQSQQG